MLLLYLHEFGTNTCKITSPKKGISEYLYFQDVTGATTGIESRNYMRSGIVYIKPHGYRNLFNTEYCTISLWLHPGSGAGGIFTGNESTTGASNRGYSMFLYPSASDLHLSWQGNEDNKTVIAPVIYNCIKQGAWNHICVVKEYFQVKVYVNGVIVGTYSLSSWTKDFSRSGDVPLVRAGNSYIDAFRVYNHALSEAEVLNLYKYPVVCINDTLGNRSDANIQVGKINMTDKHFGVPKEYQQVEFISFDRGPCIDTGLTFTSTSQLPIKIEAVVATRDSTGTNFCLAGCGNSQWNGPVMLNLCNNKMEFGTNGYQASTVSYSVGAQTTYTATINNTSQYFSMNDGQIIAANRTFATSNYPLYIGNFKTSSTPSTSTAFNGYVYMFRIYSAGAIVRDFIPVRRISDGVLGLFDLVTWKFYTNVGSGSFWAGDNEIILPDDYQRVSYIQASGAQQINTEIYFNPEVDSCEVQCQATTSSQNGMILASQNATRYFWLYHYKDSGAIALYIQNTSQAGIQTKAVDTTGHKIKYTGKTIYNDNTSYGTYSQTFTTTTYPLYLCSWGGGYYYNGRIYYCKIWSNGTLVRDMWPCYRKKDNKPGMFDLVSRRFFTNSGSGDFTLGTKMFDCPTGHSALWFKDAKSIMGIASKTQGKLDKQLTLNVWAYMRDWYLFKNNMRLFSCTEGGGWNIETSGDYIGAALYTNAYSNANFSHLNNLAPGWHMFTMTFNYIANRFKIYLDGNLINTISTPASYIQYNTGNYIYIGCEATGTDADGGCYFKGMLGDFRIISNELTAAEVSTLYNGKPLNMTVEGVLITSGIARGYPNFAINSRGVLSCFDAYCNLSYVQYITDWLFDGSNANSSNHWNGIRIYDHNGNNISGYATSKLDGTTDSTTALLRDPIAADNWAKQGMSGSYYSNRQEINLGKLRPVQSIEVHHYGEDNRKYTRRSLCADDNPTSFSWSHDDAYTERPISSGSAVFYPSVRAVRFLPNYIVIGKNIV